MWVRSQNKKELANYITFSVTGNFGGKKKSAIVGTISENSFWGSKTKILGLYDTVEMALEELTRLETALINQEKVYQMS